LEEPEVAAVAAVAQHDEDLSIQDEGDLKIWSRL
jgi:hypothetical protein